MCERGLKQVVSYEMSWDCFFGIWILYWFLLCVKCEFVEVTFNCLYRFLFS